MPTESQIEYAGDANGLVTKTTTEEAFELLDPPEFGGDLRGYRITMVDGKCTKVVEEYEGNGNPVYTGDVSISEAPLESNPAFDAVKTDPEFVKWAMWVKDPKNPDLGGWSPETSTLAEIDILYDYWLQGVRTYKCPQLVIKHVTIQEEAPDLNIVGKIADPGGGFAWDGDFLCSGISFQQEGGKYRVTVEYMSSAPGKTWDPTLYGGNA